MVIVIAGKDKGKVGKVTRALPRNDALIVDGVNIKKRFERPRKTNQKGQIVSFSAPLHVSNVMVAIGAGNKRTRIGMKFESGKKVRIAKKTGAII